MADLRVGDRVQIMTGVIADLYGRGVEGTVVLISTTGSCSSLYHVRLDPPRPQDPLSLYRDEIEPHA
jgi:hypothetical protein